MNETLVTVVGNVATEPESQVTAAGAHLTRFRLATAARRYDTERGAWTDGPTSFYTVRAWRALAVNVKDSIGLGQPLVVQGRLRIREEDRDGRRYQSAEIEAVALGHDLNRGVSAFTRAQAGAARVEIPAPVPPPGGESATVSAPLPAEAAAPA